MTYFINGTNTVNLNAALAANRQKKRNDAEKETQDGEKQSKTTPPNMISKLFSSMSFSKPSASSSSVIDMSDTFNDFL